MDPHDAKRPRLSPPQTCADQPESAPPELKDPGALAAELAAVGDVRGLLLLESKLHAVLAEPDAACVKVVGFFRRDSTCERLVHELLLSGTITASSDSERAVSSADQGEADTARLGASDAGRAAFAASCVLGGGIPEVAATLATSDTVWRSLVSKLRREQPSRSVRALSASMLERMCRSFFLRAGSKAREGFVVMAKRHGLLQVALDDRLQMPQLLSLLPLIYRHDHSPKRYAYWASLELGLQLTNRILAALSLGQVDDISAGVVLVEDEYACEALIGMCEWSAGDRSRPAGLPMKATSSTHARQWGLSLLAELAEGSHAARDPNQTSPDPGIGQMLVDLAATDCTLSIDGRQQSPLLGVRGLTAVLSLSASLRQPTSSDSHAAIALATSVAARIPQVVATLEQLAIVARSTAKAPRCFEEADGRATPLCRGSTDVLIQAVRFIGAACDMVASCACGRAALVQHDSQSTDAIDPLRTALVRAHAPTVLMRLLLAATGGTLAAPHIVTALEHVWAAPTMRDELFLRDDWWTQWCLPLLDRAQLHATAGDTSASYCEADHVTGSEILPSLGHIVTLSCLCDETGTDIETEVLRQLTLQSSSCNAGDSPVGSTDKNGEIDLSEYVGNSGRKSDDRHAMWRKHMAVISAACKERAVTDRKLAQLKRKLKQQKRDAHHHHQKQGACSSTDEATGAAAAPSAPRRSSVGVDVKRMPMAD